MALQASYQQFLAAPNSALLASDATLNYITTLTSVTGPTEILKHLNRQAHDLKKKEEKFLDAVEGSSGLAVEVYTTIEFVNGGGAYLPGLDDNFLADRTVNLPIIHIVTFDSDGKIQQIRQSWDQGSLLKQIDIIGRTGKNWPIRDGKDQIKLITSSVKLSGHTTGSQEETGRSRGNSNHITGDPHASLQLFAPREKYEGDSFPVSEAPRQAVKPPQRNMDDLISGHANDFVAESPAPRAGTAKKFAPSRVFDDEQHEADALRDNFSPKVNAKKYQHFDIAGEPDTEEEARIPAIRQPKKQHTSQWNFDDFSTPAKVVPSKLQRTNDLRHWGTSDDEVMDSPIKFKKVDKPRKDAEPHFEFKDDGTPEGGKRIANRSRGAQSNSGMGLYKDRFFGEEDDDSTPVQKKSTAIADTNARRKVFDSQFDMTDDSPAAAKHTQHISDDRAKAVKMMDANWSSYDQSPVSNQKENVPTSPTASRSGNKGPLAETTNQSKGINIAGDGMGGRKIPIRQDEKPRGIATTGDGMGGKKGSGRTWGFGDDSDGEGEGGPNAPGNFQSRKTRTRAQPTGGDFWDF